MAGQICPACGKSEYALIVIHRNVPALGLPTEGHPLERKIDAKYQCVCGYEWEQPDTADAPPSASTAPAGDRGAPVDN